MVGGRAVAGGPLLAKGLGAGERQEQKGDGERDGERWTGWKGGVGKKHRRARETEMDKGGGVGRCRKSTMEGEKWTGLGSC